MAELAPATICEIRRELLRFADLTIKDFLNIKLTKDCSEGRRAAEDLCARALGYEYEITMPHSASIDAVDKGSVEQVNEQMRLNLWRLGDDSRCLRGEKSMIRKRARPRNALLKAADAASPPGSSEVRIGDLCNWLQY